MHVIELRYTTPWAMKNVAVLYFYDPHCIFDHLMYCHVWYILG